MKRFIYLMMVSIVLVLISALLISGCGTPATSTAPAQSTPAAPPTSKTSVPVPSTTVSSPAQSASPAPQSALTLDIGVAAPLTGPTAPLGIQMRNGALMAIEDRNSEGGVTIAGKKYMLNPIVMDTKADPQVGKTIAEQLIYDKKVKIIIGPSIEDAIGMQPVTEANKVIGIFLQPIMPEMSSTQKPYTFFTPGPILQFYEVTTAYIAKNYPKAKTVVSVMPDLVDTPVFINPAKQVCQKYGLQWVRAELFPITTKDFSPLISKMLAGNPDIIDTASTGGKIGGLTAVLMKQLREAGFKGIIMVPAAPPQNAVMQVLPEQYRTNTVIFDIDSQSPSIPSTYRDLYQRLSQKFPNDPPYNITGKIYNVSKGFFQCLNGQSAMDTTAWMQAFADYRWKNDWGEESFFCGKPIWGINRMCFGATWVSELTNGKYETKAQVPVTMDWYYSK